MKLPVPYILKLFIPLAFIMTVSAGLIYVVAQQNYRLNANDPQIQLAEDFAAQLTAGRTVDSINTSASIDMAKSLSLFIFVYDDAGKFVAGSGKLNGQYPVIPVGVLDYAKKVGENRITWQPQTDVRVALVVVRYEGSHSGYVAVGRSLREVEQRVSVLGWQVLGAWLASLVGLFVLIAGSEILISRRSVQ